MNEITELPDAAAGPPLITEQHSVRRILFQDSVGYFASKIVPGCMGLVSIPVFIRILGTEEYGRFAVIFPLLMAIGSASSGWLTQGVLRFHPSPTDNVARKARFGIAVVAGASLSVALSSAVLILVVLGLHYPLVSAMTVLAFGLSLVIYMIVLANLQAQLRPLSVLRREIVRSVSGFACSLLLVALTGQKRFDVVLLGQALGYAIASAPMHDMSLPIRQQIESLSGARLGSESVGSALSQLWHFGWAVGLWLLLSQTLPVIDRWVIQKFAGYSSAGVYASLHEVAIRSFSFLIFPLTQAAHPRIMRSWNQGEPTIAYQMIRNSIKYQLIIFLIVFAAVWIFAARIARGILGFDNPTAAHMLPFLVLGGFLWQLALLVHKPLEIRRETAIMLAGMTVTVAVDFVGNYLLVPRFGYLCAAYMVVVSALSYVAIILCTTRFRAFRTSVPLVAEC